MDARDFDDALPAVAEAFGPLYAAVTTDPVIDSTILELCRIRVAMLLGCDDEAKVRHTQDSSTDLLVENLSRWPTSDVFDDRQRAAVGFAEQFLMDAKDMAAQVAALQGPFSDDEIFALTVALGLFESRQRALVIHANLRSQNTTRDEEMES